MKIKKGFNEKELNKYMEGAPKSTNKCPKTKALIEERIGLSFQGAKMTGDLEKDNWQTPTSLYQAIKEFLGDSFFDPCPHKPTFDGLNTDWVGNIYVNPPFSKYYQFITKGLIEFANSNSTEIIWLSNSNTETKYYQMLVKESSALFFFNKRLSFLDAENKPKGGNTKGQTLFYMGYRPKAFLTFVNSLGGVGILNTERGN